MADDLNKQSRHLPRLVDDSACEHLSGMRVPSMPLLATTGDFVCLATAPGRTVVYCYPRTGRPDHALPPGWNDIPGAPGCTPQACGFRDHFQELQSFGAHVYGLSSQDTAYQSEAAQRLHLPFPLLSDADLSFARALCLPTFEFAGMTLIKRLTLILHNGTIDTCFYPVVDPGNNAADVMRWLAEHSDQ